MHLVLYGPEGSGKGTQAKLLSHKFKLPIYTSGDLVREAAENDKGLIGDVARRSLEEGKYVPNSEMFVLWKNKLKTEESKKGFILDGLPRNLRQAKFLFRKASKYSYKIDKVIFITINEKESVERLKKRQRKLFAGSHENHDTEERVLKRLSIYRAEEEKTLNFFRDQKVLLRINGEQPIQKVFHDIVAGLGDVSKNTSSRGKQS